MKKNFFYLAFAAFAAISLTACSSDDDDSSNSSNGNNNSVTLTKPANADKAAVITIANGGIEATVSAETENAPVLETIELTESDQVLIELKKEDDTPIYILDKPVINGNTYTFNSERVKGTIQLAEAAAARLTRAGNHTLIINILVFVDGVWTKFETEPAGVQATVQPSATTTEDVVNWLARTWTISGVTFDVHLADNGVTAFKDFYSTNGVFDLEQILNEALARNVALNDKDKRDMKRKIKNITLTKQKFIVSYTEGDDDVADWSWANAEKTRLKIQLKSDQMGNKFISNDTKIDVAFNGNRCNLTLNVEFTDDANKKWDSSLVIHLQ